MFVAIIYPKDKYRLINTYQTGEFTHISRKGYKYILVLYNYYINSIKSKPLKSIMQVEILLGYKKLHSYF